MDLCRQALRCLGMMISLQSHSFQKGFDFLSQLYRDFLLLVEDETLLPASVSVQNSLSLTVHCVRTTVSHEKKKPKLFFSALFTSSSEFGREFV